MRVRAEKWNIQDVTTRFEGTDLREVPIQKKRVRIFVVAYFVFGNSKLRPMTGLETTNKQYLDF